MANQLSLSNISGLATQQNFIDFEAVRPEEQCKLIRYQVTLSGLYVQHTRGQDVGEVIDLTKALPNATGVPRAYWGNRGASRVYLINPGGTGYSMSIVPGADLLHWLLVVYSAIATELAAGAYPAGLTTDLDIIIEASGRACD
jgi:hypothetical protein